MYAKCIKCGSEKTHSSRVRPGERTMGTLFLRPMRCRDCKERFWVRNPNAYLAAGATLVMIGLFIGVIWLIISDTPDRHIVRAPEVGSEQSPPSEAAKPYPDPAARPDAKIAGNDKSSGDAKIALGARSATPSTQELADDHYLRVQLYQENAEKGDSDAQYKLGLLYLTGNGALQDFVEAARWLKLAAEQGYALAQYELGLIYRTGQGLVIDQVQSYMWLNLAAAAGIQQAVMVRDEVMKSLSAKQLVQAQKISREWLAARSKSKPNTPKAVEMKNNGVSPTTAIVQPDITSAGQTE